MKIKPLMWMCVCTLAIVAVGVFASPPSTLSGAFMQPATTDSLALAPLAAQTKDNRSIAPLPQIKWNMSTEQISKQVDTMIAAVNRSNPIDRVKLRAFTDNLSKVRDTVVKNDMVAYQKAVIVLAGVSTTLSDKEQSQLNQVLRQSGAGLSSTCSITCMFGSCTSSCNGGLGGGAVCLCIWGFPQCGCGNGGASMM